MKNKFVNLILSSTFCLILTNCSQTGKKNQEINSNLTTDSAQTEIDTLGLTNFVRNLYKWHETKSLQIDFDPTTGQEQDSLYIGIDWNKHKKRLKELEETNFFSKNFFDNYNHIAETVDKELKNKSGKWFVGELSPYGKDANPWCDCQDNPKNYWKTLKILNAKKENNDIKFSWTWNNKSNYIIIATKTNGSWKVKYLQGFDYKEYLHK